MADAVEVWKRLMEPACETLRHAAADADPSDVSAVARLRKKHPADLVHVALLLSAARRKLARKWPGRAFVADPEGAEMASGVLAAAHKAGRFAGVATASPDAGPVLDLCCGIGADAVAMVGAGLPVEAIDRDPLRAWMAGVNAGCPTRVADVTGMELGGAPFHLDPSRRDETGRRIRYDLLTPGPEFIERACDGRTGAVKLPPGVSPGEAPEGELEYISERGSMTQAVLWVGNLARATVSATRLVEGEPAATIAGEPQAAYDIPFIDLDEDVDDGAWIHTVDASVERAALLASLCVRTGLAMPHPQTGLLIGEERSDDPFLTAFRLRAVMPWRRPKVRDWLRAHGVGLVEVKTRGKAADPDAEQKALRGKGDTPFVVFVLRFDQAVKALICERR